MVCLGNEQNGNEHSVIFEIAPKYCIWGSFVDYEGYSISSKWFLPAAVDIMVIWIKCAHSHHFSSLIPKMSMFTLAISFDHIQFTLIHGPHIPGSYVILFFTASDFTFTSRHIHNWMLFPLWLSLFILSGAISLLFPSSILDTYWPGQGGSAHLSV